MAIRVVVVDGHTLTRFGLTTLAAAHPDLEVVAEASTAAEAPAVIAASAPDVVTVAVGLPDADGLRLARDLRDRYPSLGIVVLTAHGEDDVLFRALETGASAFVGKSAPVEEILCAIRHAAVAASSFTAAGLATAMARRQSTTARLALSPREREVLALLQDGVSIPAIARTLYVSPSTAKTYVSRLYEKLGASNRAQALMAALRNGLIRNDAATA
jgi:DNA-binding NarL/FixJ family response regulator